MLIVALIALLIAVVIPSFQVCCCLTLSKSNVFVHITVNTIYVIVAELPNQDFIVIINF